MDLLFIKGDKEQLKKAIILNLSIHFRIFEKKIKFIILVKLYNICISKVITLKNISNIFINFEQNNILNKCYMKKS